MLSGIGPRVHLEEMGVFPIIADLPVGNTLSGHFVIPFDFLLDNSTELGWTSQPSESRVSVENLYQFLANSWGPLTRYPGLEMYIASGVNGNREWPDGMLYLICNYKCKYLCK